MIVTLRNNFHNTEARVRIEKLPAKLTPAQTARAARKLCGIRECHCQTVNGPQDVFVTDWWNPFDEHAWELLPWEIEGRKKPMTTQKTHSELSEIIEGLGYVVVPDEETAEESSVSIVWDGDTEIGTIEGDEVGKFLPLTRRGDRILRQIEKAVDRP